MSAAGLLLCFISKNKYQAESAKIMKGSAAKTNELSRIDWRARIGFWLELGCQRRGSLLLPTPTDHTAPFELMLTNGIGFLLTYRKNG
jgi:hypothetical protein